MARDEAKAKAGELLDLVYDDHDLAPIGSELATLAAADIGLADGLAAVDGKASALEARVAALEAGGPTPPPPPPPNLPPVAALSVAVDGLQVSASAAASLDPDGSIAMYEWRADGGPWSPGLPGAADTWVGTLQAGLHTLELRVTDDLGAMDTASAQFATADPAPPPPPPPGGSAEATIEWNLVTKNADGSEGFPNTFRVWVDGVETQGVLSDPGAVRATLVGLSPGLHLVEVAAIDAAGSLGEKGSLTIDAQVRPVYPTPDQVISALPATITQPGVYQLAAGSYTVNAGAAVTINAPNVTLFAKGDAAIRYGVAGSGAHGNAVKFGADNAEVFGLSCVWGGMRPNHSFGVAAFSSGWRTKMRGIHIHDCHVVMDAIDASGQPITGIGNWQVEMFRFRDMTDLELLIEGCDLTFWGGEQRLVHAPHGVRMLGNQIRMGKSGFGTSIGYTRLLQGNFVEFGGNTIEYREATNNQSGFTGFTAGPGGYCHGNAWRIIDCNRTRPVLCDNMDGVVVLHERWEVEGAPPGGDQVENRPIRQRVERSSVPKMGGWKVGFCTAIALPGATRVPFAFQIGGDYNQGVVDGWYYGNRFTGFGRGIRLEGAYSNLLFADNQQPEDNWAIPSGLVLAAPTIAQVS